VAVKSGQTIVLGGAVRESDSRSRTKIPILGDIPILGRLFNSDRRGKGRTETIVFITPYVLDTKEQVDRETRRRRDALNIQGMWKHGWSGSNLAEPAEPKKQIFPREQKKVPSEGSPRPRPLTGVTPWKSSSGKIAHGGNTSEPPVETEPETSTEPADNEPKVDDVDAFIREQQRKWDETVRGLN
jgi:hypothetical protein